MFTSSNPESPTKYQLLKTLYNGKLTPNEEPFESELTLKSWHDIEKIQADLSSTLSITQLDLLAKLNSYQSNRLSHSIEDSFCYVFQLDAKLLMEVLR